MKAQVNRVELIQAATACDRAVSKKTTLPILSSMLLTVEGDRLLLQGTDLELTMQSAVAVTEAEVGRAAVPAETFLSLVRGLTAETVKFTLSDDGAQLLVKCGRSNYKVPALAATEYPPSPTVEPGQGFAVEGEALGNALGRVLGACSLDDTRPVICGMKWEVEPGTLRLIATDTHRLHITTLPVEEVSGAMEFVLSRRASAELAKLVTSDLCTVTLDKNLVEVCSTWGIFTARLTEGVFPNWRRVVPAASETLIMLRREEVMGAAKRAGIVADGNMNRLNLALSEEGVMAMTARSEEHGEADEAVEVVSQKGAFEPLYVNYKFFLSALQAIPSDTVLLKTEHPLAPVVIHGADREVFQSVIMPMQV